MVVVVAVPVRDGSRGPGIGIGGDEERMRGC